MVRLVFQSRMDDLTDLSVLPLLIRGTMSLEEEIRGVFESDSFLIRDETLAGGFLSSGSRSSFP